jgi:hypothetical protein
MPRRIRDEIELKEKFLRIKTALQFNSFKLFWLSFGYIAITRYLFLNPNLQITLPHCQHAVLGADISCLTVELTKLVFCSN